MFKLVLSGLRLGNNLDKLRSLELSGLLASVTMSNSYSSSSQHILITYAEYERLKNVEQQFEKLQNKLHKKLQIPSKHSSFKNNSFLYQNKITIAWIN